MLELVKDYIAIERVKRVKARAMLLHIPDAVEEDDFHRGRVVYASEDALYGVGDVVMVSSRAGNIMRCDETGDYLKVLSSEAVWGLLERGGGETVYELWKGEVLMPEMPILGSLDLGAA